MGLEIKKFGYSSKPWRFSLNGEEFRIGGQPYFSFPRKRDAKPFLEKLVQIGSWDDVANFTDDQKQQVFILCKETEVFKLFQEITNRKVGPFL